MILAVTVSMESIAAEEEQCLENSRDREAAKGLRERSEGVGEKVVLGKWNSAVPKRMNFEAADIMDYGVWIIESSESGDFEHGERWRR